MRFEGNIVPFTGTVNMEITDATGDKFIGRLYMAHQTRNNVFTATGHTEQGNGKTDYPREYQIRVPRTSTRLTTKAFVAQQRIKDSETRR